MFARSHQESEFGYFWDGLLYFASPIVGATPVNLCDSKVILTNNSGTLGRTARDGRDWWTGAATWVEDKRLSDISGDMTVIFAGNKFGVVTSNEFLGCRTGGNNWTVYCNNNGNTYRFSKYYSGADIDFTSSVINGGASGPRLMAVTHRDGTGADFYIDGVADVSDGANTGSNSYSSRTFYLGGGSDADHGLGEVLIYDRWMSAGEVAEIYRLWSADPLFLIRRTRRVPVATFVIPAGGGIEAYGISAIKAGDTFLAGSVSQGLHQIESGITA